MKNIIHIKMSRIVGRGGMSKSPEASDIVSKSHDKASLSNALIAE
jgi:hypothetical protein